MIKKLVLITTVFSSLTGTTAWSQDGEKLFRKCKACHAADTEKNKVGPYLKGIYGRQVAAVEGYKYSKAMAAANFVWDDENLDKFLEKPKSHVPGTKMAFPGMKKPADRTALIGYLKSVSQN